MGRTERIEADNARNSLSGGAKFLIPALANAASTVIIFRSLGAGEFGLYAISLAVATFGSLAQIGAPEAIVNAVARNRRQVTSLPDTLKTEAELLAAGLVICVWAALITIGLSLIALTIGLDTFGISEMDGNQAGALLTSAGSMAFIILANPFMSVWEGNENYSNSALFVGSRSVLSAVTEGAAAIYIESVVGVLTARATVSGIALGVVLFLYRSKIYYLLTADVKVRLVYQRLRELVVFGWNISLGSLGVIMLRRGVYFLVGAKLGSSWVGIYSVFNEATSKLHSAMGGLFQFIFPLASRAHKSDDNNRRIADTVEWAITFSQGVIAVAVVGAIVASPFVVQVFLGPEVTVEQLIIASFVYISSVVGYYLLGLSSVSFHLVNGLGRPDIGRNFNIMLIVVVLALATISVELLGAWGLVGIGAAVGSCSVVFVLWSVGEYLDKMALGEGPVHLATTLLLGGSVFCGGGGVIWRIDGGISLIGAVLVVAASVFVLRSLGVYQRAGIGDLFGMRTAGSVS